MTALNRKVLMSLLLSLALFAGLGGLTYRGFHALMLSSWRLQTTHQALARMDSILRSISQAQSGQRDFLLTGESSFLEACQNALFSVDDDLRQIRHTVQDTPFADRLAQLNPLLVKQVDFFKESFRVRREVGRNAAAALIRRQSAEESLDKLYNLANGMMAEESAMLESQDAELKGRFASLRRDMILEAIGALALTLAIAWFVHGEMKRRTLAETELSRQHNVLQLVLDHMQDAVLVLGPMGQMLMANPAARKLFGSGVTSTPVEAWAKLGEIYQIDGETRLAWEQTPIALALKGESSDDVEIFVRTGKAPKGLYLNVMGRALRDDGGQLAGGLVVCRDISAQRKRVALLHESNEALQASVGKLERQNNEISQLSHLVEALQASQSMTELAQTCGPLLGSIFEGLSGGVMLLNPSRTSLRQLAGFGTSQAFSDPFAPQECWALRRGQPHFCNAKVSSMACPHHQALHPAESLCLPLMAQGELMGLFHVSSPQMGVLDERRQKLAGVMSEQLSLAMANLTLRERLKNQSILDPLTGLYNRRYMEESFEREMARSAEAGVGLGLVMVDVDHFKQFNDRFGHEAGDLVLKQIAQTLRSSTRPTDVVCRFGGEELVLLLPGAQIEQALKRAEACRAAVEALDLSAMGRPLGKVTVSMGVAAAPADGIGLDELTKAADKALYQAKNSGRNRVVSARAMKSPQAA